MPNLHRRTLQFSWTLQISHGSWKAVQNLTYEAALAFIHKDTLVRCTAHPHTRSVKQQGRTMLDLIR